MIVFRKAKGYGRGKKAPDRENQRNTLAYVDFL
jgi:hypothetical protein